MSSSLKSNFTDNFGLSNKLKRVKLPPLDYKVEVFSILSLQEKNTRHVIFSAEGYFDPHLRTVPTIVIAHTFCASPDTRISYRQCLLIQGYFCAV